MSNVRLSNGSPTLERTDARLSDHPKPSACRNLFGPVDHEALRENLKGHLQEMEEASAAKWDFDFAKHMPLLNGTFEWELVDCNDLPHFYSREKRSEKGVCPSGTGRVDLNGNHSCLVSARQPRGGPERCDGHKERCDGQTRCDGQQERCDGHTERCDGQTERCDGQQERCDGQMERCDGQMERCDGQQERCDGQMERCDGHTERCDGQTGWKEQCAGPRKRPASHDTSSQTKRSHTSLDEVSLWPGLTHSVEHTPRKNNPKKLT